MLLAGGTTVDLIGEGVPNWVMAVTGVLTLAAAVAAALFARSAAKHAGEQVKEAAKQTAEAHRQVELAEKQEAIAQRTLRAQAQESWRQHEAAVRVETRALEARLDERMPFIIARAKLTFSNLFVRSSDRDEWIEVEATQRMHGNDAPAFKQQVSLRFENVSSMPARIDIVDAAHGELEGLPSGEPLVVAPGGSAQLRWIRVVDGRALVADDDVESPDVWLFNLRFWVRDLAMLVRDEYLFSASLRHFSRDGSALVASPLEPSAWPAGQSIASLLPDRTYERLSVDPASE